MATRISERRARRGRRIVAGDYVRRTLLTGRSAAYTRTDTRRTHSNRPDRRCEKPSRLTTRDYSGRLGWGVKWRLSRQPSRTKRLTPKGYRGFFLDRRRNVADRPSRSSSQHHDHTAKDGIGMHSPAARRQARSNTAADCLMRTQLLRTTLILVVLASACGDGTPSASDLRASFAAQLAANRFVSNVQPEGDTITFSWLATDGRLAAWRIVIDSVDVQPNDDPKLPVQGDDHIFVVLRRAARPAVGSRVQLTGGADQQRPGAGMLGPLE